MIALLHLLIALAIVGLPSLAIWIHIRRQDKARIKRLANPVLNGIPLPAIHDPRWVRKDFGNQNHWGLVGEYVLGKFHLSTPYFVYLDGTQIGEWREYVEAVEKVMKGRGFEALKAKALEQLKEVG